MKDERDTSGSLTNTWLELSGGFGRFGAAFLIVAHLLLLLAPLFLLANLRTMVPRGGTTPEQLLVLLSAPEQLLWIADLLAIPGMIFLSVALLLMVLGLRSEKAPVNPTYILLALAAFVTLLAWLPVTLYSQGRSTGVILTLDEVASTGGFTVASALILLSALLWMAFTLGVQKDLHISRLTSLHWPIYAALLLLGSTAIAAFAQSLVAGAPSQDVLLIGVILKATLIPVLGVIAYANLREKFYAVKMMRFVPRDESKSSEDPAKRPAPPPPDESPSSPQPSQKPASSPAAATSRR